AHRNLGHSRESRRQVQPSAGGQGRPRHRRSHEARCLPVLLRAAPVDARRNPRQVIHSPRGERAMKRIVSGIVGAVAAATFLTVNIGEPVARAEAQGHTMAAMTTSSTKASGLRSTLNTLFQEHIYLAAAATGAALGGREAEFKAAAAALDANSVAISKAIGS